MTRLAVVLQNWEYVFIERYLGRTTRMSVLRIRGANQKEREGCSERDQDR